MIPLGLAQQVTNNQKPKTTPKAKPKVSDNLATVMAAVDMHLGTKQGDPRREAIKSYILSKDPTGNDAERLSHEALAAQNPLMNVVNPPKPQTRPTGAPSPLTDEEVAKRADVARRRQIQTNPKSTPAEVIGSYRPRNNPTKTQANQRNNPDTPEYKMREYDESQGFGVTSGVRPPGVSDDAWQARMRQREVATGSGQWVEDPEQAMMRGAAFNPRTGMNSPTKGSEAHVAVGKNIDRLSKENSPGAALGKVVGGVTKYSGQAFSDTYFNGLRPAIYEAEIKGGRTPKQAKELLDTFDDYAGQFAQVLASIVTGGASAAAAGTRFANALKGMNHAAQVQLAPMVLQLSDPRTTPEERVAMIQQMAKEPSTWLMVIGHGLPKAIRAAVPVDTSSVKGLDMRRSAIVMKGVQDMQSGIPVEPAAKAHIKTAAEKLGNPDPDAVFQTQVELVQKGASPEDALNAAKVIHSVAEPVNEGGRHKIQDSEQPVVPNPSFLEEGDLDILAPTPKRTPAKVQKPVAEPAAVEGQKWESKVAHVDNRHGENIFEAVATADGKIIGVVDYSEVRGNVVIKHVEVLPEWRRKGVATSLYDAIKAEHPGAKMDTLGSRTNEGKAFRKAYDIKYPANKTQVQNTPETAAPSNDRQIKPTPTDTPQPAPKAVEGESVQPAKPAETPNVRKPTVAELDFMDEPKPKAVKAPKPEPKVETPENAPFPINARGNRTSINGAVAYPRSVGAKFSTEEIASVKEWGQANGYHINATPTKISIIGDSGGAIADSINSAKSLTNAEVESKAKLDAYNTRQAQTQAENAKTVSSNAGVWLDSTFGADFANDFNKAALVRFIEGKDAKFQGGASRKWADGLEKLGITPDDARVALSKIKEAYEASQPTKSETAQANVKPVGKGNWAASLDESNKWSYLDSLDDSYKGDNPMSKEADKTEILLPSGRTVEKYLPRQYAHMNKSDHTGANIRHSINTPYGKAHPSELFPSLTKDILDDIDNASDYSGAENIAKELGYSSLEYGARAWARGTSKYSKAPHALWENPSASGRHQKFAWVPLNAKGAYLKMLQGAGWKPKSINISMEDLANASNAPSWEFLAAHPAFAKDAAEFARNTRYFRSDNVRAKLIAFDALQNKRGLSRTTPVKAPEKPVESVKPAKPVEVPTVRKPTVAELDFMDEPKPKPAPKAQEPKAAVGKELWQMTAEDAVKADPSYAAYQELGSPDLIIYHDTQIRDARFNSMLDAIKRGENVPDSAISEYVMAGQQSKTIDVRKQIVQNARRLAREGKSSSELSAMDGAYVRESLAIRDGEKASPKPAPVKGGKEMRRLTVGGADHETGGAKTEQVLSAPVDVGAPEGIDYFIGRRSVDNRWVVSNGEIAPIGFGDTREAAIAKARKFYERAPTKSAAAKANLKAAVSEFLDESNKLGARWSPEQEAVKLQKAINVAKRAAEYGWATVEDAIKATAEVFGRKLQKQEERVLRQAWESVHGKPEPTKHSEPATPIKPPKPPQNASAEPETPNKGYQGFTHADTARLREVYGLPAYEKSGKSLDVLVKEAYDQGHVKNAENIAREVIDKPRPLSAQENVAVLLGMDKAITAEEAATAALGKGYADKLPPSEIAKLEFDQAHANDLANTFISAHELSGSEQGRALGSRRIIMNRGYGPDTLRYKAQSALKRGLKPEESAKVAELGNAVKDAEAKVSEVEGKVNTRQIDAAIKTHKTARASSNRFFTEDRYQAIKAKRGKGGVGSNKRRGASVNWAEEFADLIYVAGYHIERGVRSSAEFIAKVREDIPEATDADIARAANEAVAQKRSNAEPKKPPTKLTLPQMLKELSEIGGIQDEAAKANLAELRAKAQEISKLPEEKSMEAMQGWREEIIKLQRNLNRGSKQGADVFTSGKHTVNDPELNAARAKLYAAKKEADAWIKHLENRTRRESIGAVRRGLEDVWDVLGLPRALMTSADASGIFRQGWILALTRQKAALEGISMMKKGAWTEEKFNAAESQLMHKYEQSGRLAEMKDAGLEILEAGNGIGPHQEDYATRITGAKIKGREVFAHVKISERAFALESNAKRMFAFDQIASAIESDGVKLTRAERQGLANYIDVTAGLAHVKNGHGMARIFFSPKYWLSRIQFMMGQPIAKAGSPRMQKAIAAEYVKFYTVTATLLGLAAAGGLTTLDAQDSDFGKIKFGNTRIDLTGGLGTHFIAMMRLGAHFLDKTMGTKLHEGSGSYQAESYLRSRLAPLPGAAYSYTFGRKDGKPTNAIGMETGPGETARELVLPLTVSQGVRDAQEGIPPEQISLAVIANLLGLSASSYDKSKRESKAKPKATSKSKVEYAGRTYAGRTR